MLKAASLVLREVNWKELANIALSDSTVKTHIDEMLLFVVISPSLPRDGGTARPAIQVYAINLIKIRLGERWQPILNQSWLTGSPTTNKADCHCWVPKSRLL